MDHPPPDGMTVASGDMMTCFEHMFAGQLLGRDASDPPLSKWGQSSLVLAFLTVPVLLFMLLPVLNLVNINLSRIMERSSEIGVRKAFGASSKYLVGQFLVENIILTVLGGVMGLVLSLVVLKIYTSLQLIPYGQLRFNGWIFIYGFVITIVFGILSGVYPAWKMSRLHPVDALLKSSF